VVHSAALPRDLGLVPWEPHALARGLTLRHTTRGHLLQRLDQPPFAWIDDLAQTHFAPQAVTAAGTLAMGREDGAPGRFVVIDQAGARLASIAPRRGWTEVDLELASGRLRLSTLVVERGWVARDEAGRTVMRIVSRSDAAARMTLIGDTRGIVELPTVLAVAYAVLLSDELPSATSANAKPS
jgi:hypothetical protein